MMKDDHPFQMVRQFINSDSKYTLSKYIYLPDSVSDEREFIHVLGKDFTEELVSVSVDNLTSTQELAFHSVVDVVRKNGSEKKHIPMIDFTVKDKINQNTYFRLKHFIDKKIFNRLVFYSSGRSFHAYAPILITNTEWKKFMASLLLVNPAGNENSIIDTRWVGHRLLSGYGTLRWSHNSGKYLQEPKRYDLKF